MEMQRASHPFDHVFLFYLYFPYCRFPIISFIVIISFVFLNTVEQSLEGVQN